VVILVAALALIACSGMAPTVSASATNSSCPNNCSGVGACLNATGFCLCPFEFMWSEDCSVSRKDMINWPQFERYVWVVLALYSGLEVSVLVILIYITWGCAAISTQSVCYFCLLLGLACE